MPPSIGRPTPPLVISHWHTALVHLWEGAPDTPPSMRTSTLPPVVSYRCIRIVPLSREGPLTRLLPSTRMRRLRLSTTGAPKLVHLLGRPLSCLHISATLTQPPAVSYLRTSWVRPSRGALSSLPPWTRPRRLRSSLTGASRWYIFREGPLPRLPSSATLTPPLYISSGAPEMVHLPRRACHPSLSRHHSRRLQLSRPNNASLSKGLLPRARRRARRLRSSPLPSLPISASPSPPMAVSYRPTQSVHLPGGARATPLLYQNTHTAPRPQLQLQEGPLPCFLSTRTPKLPLPNLGLLLTGAHTWCNSKRQHCQTSSNHEDCSFNPSCKPGDL